MSGCGRRDKGGGGEAPPYLPSDFYGQPSVSPVPVGSRDVVASPPAGAVRGTVLLRFLSETGATIRYSFREFADDADPATLTVYQEGLSLLPPVTLWAQAEVGGVRGPVRSFAYDFDPVFWATPSFDAAVRLPVKDWQAVAPVANLVGYDPESGTPAAEVPVPIVDGLADDWSTEGRLAGLDSLGDVPETHGFIDLSWVEARETADAYYLVMASKDKPRAAEGVFYGVDFGPSNVSLTSFGKGTSFVYRAEMVDGKLTLIAKETNEAVPISTTTAVLGEVVEMRLAKADLPLLGAADDIAARPYAVDFTHGPTVADRLEPLFLRSSFALLRGVIEAPGRSWQLDVLSAASLPDPSLVSSYQEFGAAFLPGLEQINGLRVYARGSLPLYLVDKEENGYAGLNTTDRGMLSTIGPMSSRIARAQILAHEFAHYQNARASQLGPRWLQEGMSEWSSERLLYKHFPSRAVHRFLKKLRYERMLGIDAENELPLDDWGTETATIGYEKSLAFLTLLEVRVGQEALLEAFRQAVNEPMESVAFQSFLERQSGQDLEGLFKYWVYAGDPEPEADPEVLYADLDGDGLSALDEEARQTSATRTDSDSDGFPDGEELFGHTNPLVSSLDPDDQLGAGTDPLLVGAASKDLSAPFRVGGGKAQTFTYSLDPYAESPDLEFKQPLLLRPPYSVSARAQEGGAVTTPVTLSRPLFVDGAEVVIAPPADAILALPKRTTKDLHPGVESGDGVGRGLANDLALVDLRGDLPKELGAYDIVGGLVSEVDGGLEITFETAAKPDLFGEYGDYVVTFDTVEWFPTTAIGSEPSPPLYRFASSNILDLAAGAPFWSIYSAGGRATSLLKSGVSVAYGDSLKVRLEDSLLAAWREAPGDKVVCLRSEVSFDGAEPLIERGGCVTLEATAGLTTKAGSLPDHFGLQSHTVEVSVKASSQAAARASGLVDLGLSALREFEKALGRPLMERSHWPVHVRYNASGSASGTGSAVVGAYLSVASGDEGTVLDYLVVEQLARVAAADILAKSGGAPYWVQEAFIQWLTSAAMYALYPTAEVHAFHLNRLDDYECYLSGNFACSGFFSADLGLDDWTATTLASSGSVKSLAFVLDLNGKFGSAVMSRVFSTFAQDIPDASGFLSRMKGEVPASAAALDALWTTWVTSDGNEATIRARLVDNDGDDLLRLDEDKLGFSDSVFNSW